ncbi:MAG TPA: TMEM175 family protein [Kofleriaceae bacterium]|jgi:uncharacterized membrane protein
MPRSIQGASALDLAEGSPRRLETLDDGVFAIVMTLIVLQVRIPSGPADELAEQLRSLVPTLLTYGLTFITLGVLWFGNRTQSEMIRRANHPLIWINLVFLGVVSLIPFSSAFLGRYPTERLAVVIYGIHLTLASLAHAAAWIYASFRPQLLIPELTPRYLAISRIATLALAFGYAFATLLGVACPIAGLVGYLVVPVPFVLGWFYRVLSRARR